MLKKRVVVQGTPELNSMLSNIEVSEGDVLFRSEQYLQLGCDLRNLTALHKALAGAVDIENCKLVPACHLWLFISGRRHADSSSGVQLCSLKMNNNTLL